MKVNLQPLVGAVCMTYDDGAKLHNAYRPAFDAGEIVVLDFAETRIFVSRFFAAVGQLLKDYGIAKVRERLQIVNLPSAGQAPLRHSIENADRYFHDPKFQSAPDSLLEAQAAGGLMTVNYSVKATVVDLRGDKAKATDQIYVDTNAWFGTAYSSVQFSPMPPNRNQTQE